MSFRVNIERTKELASREYDISAEEVRELIILTKGLFDNLLQVAGKSPAKIKALTTKFRDAGRRSAPWKPTSSRVPGRPQDGADGNRIRRWDLPADHKFYANEISATLVEVKYYFQALSFLNSPPLPDEKLKHSFYWLLRHDIIPGAYTDPLQLIPVDLDKVLEAPTTIQSGHIVPLDRGGKHSPKNTSLMLKESNSLQGNMTIEELLNFMKEILHRHEMC